MDIVERNLLGLQGEYNANSSIASH